MKRFCLILSLWLASLHIVMATVQDPEYVIMGGASYWMKATFPIEEDSILSKIVDDELEMLRGSLRNESSSCHRNYWGYWSIEDGYLYLDSLNYEPYNEEERKVIDAASLQSLKAFVKDGRVMAQWFSAEFEICRGRLLRLVSPDKWIETHEDTWNVSIENGCINMIKTVEILLLWKGNDNPQALIEIGRNIKNQFPEVKNGLKVYCNGGVFDQFNKLSDLMIKTVWPQDVAVDETARQSVCDEVKRQLMEHKMISTYLYEGTPLTEWKHWVIDM